MNSRKKQMEEVSVLYYKKNYTQQEIAKLLTLSRQTVSKLLNEAIEQNIVEIRIHDSESECRELESALRDSFGVKTAVVCGVDSANESVRLLMTARKAAEHLLPLLRQGGQKIAVSWGRTVQAVIAELPKEETAGNVVFPLFGATDIEQSCYLSNELARSFADRISAKGKYAWFPYRPDGEEDLALFRKTSYYQTMQALWDSIDLAVVGIGNQETLACFSEIFRADRAGTDAVGDISTHFFSPEGAILDLYGNTLRASAENLKRAKQVVAVACGDEKAAAIRGALKTGIVDTLITDEYTAQNVLRACI